MKRKEGFLPVFLIVFFLCILILIFSLSSKSKFFSFLEKPSSAAQGFSYSFFQKLPFISEDSKIKSLREENLNLLNRIADQERLEKENSALSDQFQTSYPSSNQLLEAKIIGAPGFVPGISLPTNFILNKGSKDNLKSGLAVISKNNIIGILTKISENLSKVSLINDQSSSFTVMTEGGAEGIIKGLGGELILNNVLLSENIKPGELVLTKGDIDDKGVGIPPDLIVGKIISVDKNASDLFQKAKIESLINFKDLSAVFVYLKIE